MYINSRVNSLSDSVTLELNAKANQLEEAGREIYNLTAGQLPHMPPENFIYYIRESLDKVKSYQYSPVGGNSKLRSDIIEYIEKTRNISYKDSGVEVDCIISNGGKHCITNVLETVIEPGDEIIILTPYWISYPEMVKLFDAKMVFVESNKKLRFVPSIKDLKKKISKKTRAIIVNSPNNPSGINYNKKWMKNFADVLAKYPNVAVISDEIYYELAYNGETPTYFYQYNKELLKRTIIVQGISKSLACTGLRIGYCIGPKTFVNAMIKLQSQTASGANSIAQKALKNFDFREIENFLDPIKKQLMENSMIVKNKLEKVGLGDIYYDITSAFYFMLDFTKTKIYKRYLKDENDKTDYASQICIEILEKTGVVIVPGSDFGVSNSARLSLVLKPENFSKAMDILILYISGIS